MDSFVKDLLSDTLISSGGSLRQEYGETLLQRGLYTTSSVLGTNLTAGSALWNLPCVLGSNVWSAINEVLGFALLKGPAGAFRNELIIFVSKLKNVPAFLESGLNILL